MLDPKQLDDLARRFADSMPKGLQVLHEDINRSVRATIESALGRLDLVTREEFDVQAAVLARTRARLEALEAKVAELEAETGVTGVATGAPSRDG
jgi:BMFP domain-containing protein YqiC